MATVNNINIPPKSSQYITVNCGDIMIFKIGTVTFRYSVTTYDTKEILLLNWNNKASIIPSEDRQTISIGSQNVKSATPIRYLDNQANNSWWIWLLVIILIVILVMVIIKYRR